MQQSETEQAPARMTEKLWTRNFVAGTAVNFLLMVNYYGLMVIITAYAMNVYEASASTAGLAASIFIIGALVARVFSGRVMDKIGRKRLLVCGAIAEVVFSFLYIADIGFGALFVLRLLHGASYGACSTTIGTVVTSIVPDSRKGEGVGYYMLSVTLGAAIGPFLGMFLSQNAGYPVVFITCAAVSVVCLIAAWSIRAPHAMPKTTLADAALGNSARSAADKPAKKGFRISNYLELSILPIGLVCALLFFCYSSLLTFLTPFSQENGLQTAASFFFVVYAIATFITRPLTGKMFDRKGDRTVMIPAFIAFIAGMALLSKASSGVALLGAAALLGFGVGTVQSSGLALSVRIAPDDRIGLANSTFYILLDIGVGIGPFALGLIEPAWGYRGLFLSMAVLAAATLLCYLRVSRKNGRMRNQLESERCALPR